VPWDAAAPDAEVSDTESRDTAHGADALSVDAGDMDATERADADMQDAVTIATLQRTTFNSCFGEGCHFCMILLPDAGCPWDQRPLNLLGTPSDVVQSLVDVPAIDSPAKVRVKAGDPDQSFIVQKLEGHLGPTEGARMPSGRSPLPQSAIDLLRTWIAQGAQAE
jgi:hypothetical protein